MHKVLIVSEGHSGTQKEGDYAQQIVHLQSRLGQLRDRSYASEKDEEGLPLVAVCVVDTAAEAVRKIKGESIDLVIFMTQGMLPVAHDIKKSHPNVKVIVLTGLMEFKDEVIILSKDWLYGLPPEQALARLLLYG